MKIYSIIWLVITAIFSLNVSRSIAEELHQTIIGAGPSANVVKLFIAKFHRHPPLNNYKFEIPSHSAKHAGGILAADSFIFGRTGRPLSVEEKAMHKEEIFLAQIPVAFAVGSDVSIGKINIDQLQKIYLGEINNWKELGGPDEKITVIGREKKEALFSSMRNKYPFFSKAKFSKIFTKDHEVITFLQIADTGKFAIGFGAESNFVTEPGITVLKVENFSVGVKIGLVYNENNKNNPVVKAVKKYANSKDWASTITKAGYLPPSS